MAVNLTNADSALKSYYLDAISEQLDNKINPFFAAIKHSTDHVYGKEVRKLTSYGVNGGIGAGAEDGALPMATGNQYGQIVATLKNLYGTIEISDKAIRASENNSGAFVSLLNAEMEGLIKSSAFNFGRMLFGDGSGVISKVKEVYEDGSIVVSNISNFAEGMIIEFVDDSGYLLNDTTKRRVVSVDRDLEAIKVDGGEFTSDTLPTGTKIIVQGSFGKEITGLGAIFSDSPTLYGLDRASNPWLNPYKFAHNCELNENIVQTVIDEIENYSGSTINLIVCSYGVRRGLQEYFSINKRVINTKEIAGGFTSMTYNGIPIVADRFCPRGTMYLLNTNDFVLHQLCDWQWMEADDGRILKQIPGKPVYSATLVKYAELICSRPRGQGVITGIIEC